jgi:hypothetical protein
MSQDQTTSADFEAVHAQIVADVMADHHERWIHAVGGFSMHRQPAQGQFLLTGPHSSSLIGSIGFVVQVRLKQGQFGSDNYILCHSDGSLMQHSNNHFYPLTAAEVEAVRPFFADRLPEDEDYSKGYALDSEESRAFGFLIGPPVGSIPRGGEGARVRTTVVDADGKESVTDTVYL